MHRHRHVYTDTHTHTQTHAHRHTDTMHRYGHMYTHTDTHTDTGTQTHTHALIQTHTHRYTHTQRHMHTHRDTHVHRHTCRHTRAPRHACTYTWTHMYKPQLHSRGNAPQASQFPPPLSGHRGLAPWSRLAAGQPPVFSFLFRCSASSASTRLAPTQPSRRPEPPRCQHCACPMSSHPLCIGGLPSHMMARGHGLGRCGVPCMSHLRGPQNI